MNKKSLYAIFAISLVITIAITIVAPTFATTKNNCNNSNKRINHGTVEISLPPGGGALTGRPTDLVLLAYDYDKSMSYTDALVVAMWIPAMNRFVPLAVIADQVPNDDIKKLWNNSPVYLESNGVVIRNNLITVADKQLQVWTEESRYNNAEDVVLTANLAEAVQLDFNGLPSATFGSAFKVPALTLMFRQIADGFAHEETQSFPSGYTLTSTHTDLPAWVHVSMPAWGYSPTTSGTIIYHETSTILPPA